MIMTNTEEQVLPKTLQLRLRDKGGERANRFTGESIYLNPMACAIFDAIMVAEYLASMYEDELSDEAQYQYDIVRVGISWFRRYDAHAYMILLD